MQTKSAKAKGRRLQNWVRDTILKQGFLSSKDIRTTIMGESGADIQFLSKEAKAFYPFSMECKNKEGLKNIYGFMEQAKSHDKELIPLVIIKSNNQKPLVILDAELFFKKW